MRILILGGGNAAQRYVESLIWHCEKEVVLCGFSILNKTFNLSTRFGLKYIDYDELTEELLCNIDMVILAIHPQHKLPILKHIILDLHYKNALILEKPLAIVAQDIDEYEDLLLHINKHAIVCQRDFDLQTYRIERGHKKYIIEFPTIYDNERDNMVHTLPHILSWLLTVNENISDIDRVGANSYKLGWDGADVSISLLHVSKLVQARVNGIYYPAVQYRELNNRIVESVNSFTKIQSTLNFNKAKLVSLRIIRLLNIL